MRGVSIEPSAPKSTTGGWGELYQLTEDFQEAGELRSQPKSHQDIRRAGEVCQARLPTAACKVTAIAAAGQGPGRRPQAGRTRSPARDQATKEVLGLFRLYSEGRICFPLKVMLQGIS